MTSDWENEGGYVNKVDSELTIHIGSWYIVDGKQYLLDHVSFNENTKQYTRFFMPVYEGYSKQVTDKDISSGKVNVMLYSDMV